MAVPTTAAAAAAAAVAAAHGTLHAGYNLLHRAAASMAISLDRLLYPLRSGFDHGHGPTWLVPPFGGFGAAPALALDGVGLPLHGALDAEDTALEPESPAPSSLWDTLLRMAVPKKKTSHMKKRQRSAHKGVELARNIAKCHICGGPRLMHHLCPSCFKAERNMLPAAPAPFAGAAAAADTKSAAQ